MIVLTATSTKDYQPGNTVQWNATSAWSGAEVKRSGKVQSISQAQSGCYFIQLDYDRTLTLIIEKL
jgi:hypothetical protein